MYNNEEELNAAYSRGVADGYEKGIAESTDTINDLQAELESIESKTILEQIVHHETILNARLKERDEKHAENKELMEHIHESTISGLQSNNALYADEIDSVSFDNITEVIRLRAENRTLREELQRLKGIEDETIPGFDE